MALNLEKLKTNLVHLDNKGKNTTDYLADFVKIPDGECSFLLRLLPPLDNMDGFPCIRTKLHRINGKSFQSLLTYNYDTGKWEGNCPLNNYWKKLWKQVNNADTEEEKNQIKLEINQVKPNERFYFNAIVRSQTDKNGNVEKNIGPKIYSCGVQVWDVVLRAICGDPGMEEPGLGDITDLKEGRDLKVIKRMKPYANYAESKFLNPSVAGTAEEMKKWMGSRHDLKSRIKLLPYEELERQIRIHQKLEEDTDGAFTYGNNVQKDEEEVTHVPEQKKDVKPIPKVQTKPAQEEEDEFGIDDDFYNRLMQTNK